MRVFILALGTRGDLELFLTLGRALRARGHHVVLGTSSFYADRVAESGLQAAAIGVPEHCLDRVFPPVQPQRHATLRRNITTFTIDHQPY